MGYNLQKTKIMNASYKEIGNVQQTEGLTGQVNSQVLAVADIVSEAVNQPTAEEQAKEQLRQVLRETRRDKIFVCCWSRLYI